METVLSDAGAWRKEAEAVIDDVKVAVKEIAVASAERLPSSDRRIFLNLTTLEGESMCVELTSRGFRVVGNAYDKNDVDGGRYFETPYSLIGERSVMFRQTFSEELAKKLERLRPPQQSDDDDDQ